MHRRPLARRAAPVVVRLLLALVATTASSTAAAQLPAAGTITGRVMDDREGPVASALLSLSPDADAVGAERRSEQARGARTTTTDATGAFRFAAVPPGTYRLHVQRLGFRTTQVTGIVVPARQTVELRVALTTAAAELAPVIVSAGAITLGRENAELGSVVHARTIALLPVGLDLRNIVALTPGARRETIWGGASAQANAYQLDGASIDHPGIGGQLLEPNLSGVETLEVKGLGAGAELGNFQGAIVNVVTRTGDNERRGAVRANIETHRLNSTNVGVSEPVPELAGRRELDAQLSGPIVRDRLFYFASGQLLQRETQVQDLIDNPGSLSPFLDERQDLKLFGKLTFQPTLVDAISLSLVHAGATGERVGRTGFERPEATHDLDVTARLATLSWARRGARTGLDVRLTASGSDDLLIPTEGADVPAVVAFRPVDPRRFMNGEFDEERRARTLTASATWRGQVNLAGMRHALTVGAEHSAGTWFERRTRAGGMTWRPATTGRGSTNPFQPDEPILWGFRNIIPLTTGGEVNLDAATENSAAYVQDDITIGSRVSVHPGLRLGRWVGRLRPADGGERFTAVRDVALEPRLGVTVDVTGRNSFLVKGHWGRYHQHLFARMFDRVAGSAAYDDEQLWYYSGPAFDDAATTFTAAEREALVAAGQLELYETRSLDDTGPADGYRQPYVDQWAFGVQKTFADRVKLEARWVSRRNRNAIALVDRNIATNHVAFGDVMVVDRQNREVLDSRGDQLRLATVYVPTSAIIEFLERQAAGQGSSESIPGYTVADLETLRWDPDFVLTTAPGAVRRFDQLQAVLTTRLRDWDVSGSVVMTTLEGNVSNVSGYDDERTRGAGAWVFPNLQVNAIGPLNEVSELEARLFMVGPLGFWGLRGGGVITARSGDRSTPTFMLSGAYFTYAPGGDSLPQLLGKAITGQHVFVEQRGLYRQRTRALLDVHLERPFQVGAAEVALAVDVFNVFSDRAPIRRNTRLDSYGDPSVSSSYGAVRAREAPRTLRIGTIVNF
jgi:hypothetical protein